MIMQQMQSAMQFVQQAASLDPGLAQMAMQQGLIAPEQAAEMQVAREGAMMQENEMAKKGNPEQRANRIATDSPVAARTRERAANASNPA